MVQRAFSENEVSEWTTSAPVNGNGAGVRPYIGSLDLAWASRAARLPGKAYHLATVIWFLWFRAGKKPVRLSHTHTEQFGIGSRARRQSLTALEEAKLVYVTRRGTGKAPIVEVIFTEKKK